MFQSLFPPFVPSKPFPLPRRVLLVSYNAANDTFSVRHYIVTTNIPAVSRIRRVTKPNTSSVVRFVACPERAVLKLKQEENDAPRHGNRHGNKLAVGSFDGSGGYPSSPNVKEKCSVRLHEIGPRLELKLLKITESLPG